MEYAPQEEQEDLLDDITLFTGVLSGNKLMKSSNAHSIVPIGGIIPYYGQISENGHPIVDGVEDDAWHICDGTNGTPDLRGRFCLGMSDAYPYRSMGGEATHKLTVDEMPSHTHHITGVPSVPGDTRNDWEKWNGSSPSGTNTDSAGGDQPHNNMPPYIALYMLMRCA